MDHDHFWQAIIVGLAIALVAIGLNAACVFLNSDKWAMIGVAAGVLALVVAWWSASAQANGADWDIDLLSLSVSGLVLVSYLSAFASILLA
jgi:hypothetical protein